MYPVLIERRDATMIVTLNRPHARNAVDASVAEGIGDALEAANVDPDVRVVVLTAAGDQSFCGGGDLKEIAAGRSLEPADPVKAAWGFGGVCEHPIDKPIIVAVNGIAVGGGAQMAFACDLVVADETATFVLPEVHNGLVAASGALVRLPMWVPRAVAMEIMLLAQPFDAAQAQAWGLVNRVTPKGRSLETALELAAIVAGHAPLAIQGTKRVIAGFVDGAQVTEQQAWARNKAEVALNRTTEDAQEGPRAFAEKRAPVYRG